MPAANIEAPATCQQYTPAAANERDASIARTIGAISCANIVAYFAFLTESSGFRHAT